MYKTLEQPRGKGRLVGETTDISVTYALSVRQEVVPAGHFNDPSTTIPGGIRIDGQIEFSDGKQDYAVFGKTLTLHLEDGRKLRVLIQGSDQIQGTGEFMA